MPRVARTGVSGAILRTAAARNALALGALLLVGLVPLPGFAPPAALAQSEQMVLSRPWARLRANPAEKSRSVAIVYGNDVLSVLEKKDGWTKVSTAAKAVGWLSPTDATDAGTAPPPRVSSATQTDSVAPAAAGVAAASTSSSSRTRQGPASGAIAYAPTTTPRSASSSGPSLPPLPPVGGSPSSADSLRRLGYSDAARRKLTDILLQERDNVAAYQATRDMLTYHPVGDLPPLSSNAVPSDMRGTLDTLRTSVLLQEGQTLVKEGKPWDAAFIYQSMVQGDSDNGRAYLELLDLLTQLMMQSANSASLENLGLAASIWKATYPDLPLPAIVQDRMDGTKKK